MNQKEIQAYAKKTGVRLDCVERHKLVTVRVPVLPAAQQIKIYFPFDSELKNAVVTRIRSMYGGVGFPATIDGVVINPPAGVAPDSFSQFVANFEGHDGKLVFENVPMFSFLQSAAVNVNCGWNCLLRYIPERSYLYYFDVVNTRGDFTFLLDFYYHSLIHD